MKKLILFFVILSGIIGNAQENVKQKREQDNDLKIATLPYYSFGKGIGITSPDSLYQVNIRFRMQNRVTYMDNEGKDGAYEAQIRRLRLRFDGYVGNPKFLYAIQLSFAPGDVGEIEDGKNINIIRDAVFSYRPNKHWNLTFGQTKLPGNRQRLNSSGALQLTDRSINNAKFTLDRDFGFQVHNTNEFKDKFSYNFKTAVSTGEGRNVTGNADAGLAFTGKVELLPLGSFSKNGAYFEGDLVREKTPKLMLSGAFQQNNHARRTQGQLGSDLFEQRTLKSVVLDVIMKYNGWAAMSSFMSRNATENAVTVNPNNSLESNYVYVGSGFDHQLSYNFPSNYEVVGRYSTQKVGDDIKALAPNTKQYTIGLTKYIWEHTFKLQSELTFETLNYFNASAKNNWYVRFQVEIEI